ncbi:hypothetical protein [Aliiroseovarius sp.]|uniref:hypothetical protein n=1 Tax=Aliiroseovarius sp. TaxID=1872442 RepID=UPI003BAA355E
MKVRLEIRHQEDGVRVYGNREFFVHLRSELDHLIECPPGGYCEFQSVSLCAERPSGLDEKPQYRVLKQVSEGPEGVEFRSVDPELYDLILMTVEDDDLEAG